VYPSGGGNLTAYLPHGVFERGKKKQGQGRKKVIGGKKGWAKYQRIKKGKNAQGEGEGGSSNIPAGNIKKEEEKRAIGQGVTEGVTIAT